VVEASPRLLKWHVGTSLREGAGIFDAKMWVNVRLNTAVKSYDGYEVQLSTGEKLFPLPRLGCRGKRNPIAGIKPESVWQR